MMQEKKYQEFSFENEVNKSRFYSIVDPKQTTAISLLGRALNAPVRINILQLLNKHPMLASDVARELDIPLSSAVFHLGVLEDADLVSVEYSTKRKGTLKWYSYGTPKNIILQIRPIDGTAYHAPAPHTTSISIGDYIDANLAPDCGIATVLDHIMENNPKMIFHPKRHDAQIVWSRPWGFLTYAIPNEYTVNGKLLEINFSMELCSEAMGYNSDFPSDITFWINDVELCTYTSLGDYGDRYGKFTPHWWFPESTKYGMLVSVSIRDKGVYLNEKLVNRNVTLKDLQLNEGNRTTIKLGVKKDAEHVGGFNIFGDRFGDFQQAINFTAVYKDIDK